MARHRTPTQQLEQRGAFEKDPQRRSERQHEPRPSGPLGDPPEYLSPAAQGVWHELASQVPDGVLTIADRFLVEIVSRQMARLRSGEELKAAETNQIISCLSRMGLTPADRSRVAVPPPPEETRDPFAELAAEGRSVPDDDDSDTVN
jgi:phage terminase small subunit